MRWDIYELQDIEGYSPFSLCGAVCAEPINAGMNLFAEGCVRIFLMRLG